MNVAATPLPADSVLIHIGPHKTGTTSIQNKLAAAREELREHGVHYPGPNPAHHSQARAFIGQPAGFAADQQPLDHKGWKRLMRIVDRNEATVVLSSEFFSFSTAADRARLAATIDPRRIHIVLGARHPGSLALSAWQQSVSSGNPASLEEWLEKGFRREVPGVGGSTFWARLEAAQLVANWSDILDPAQIHVVVINNADQGLLPTTFEQLLGLPPGVIAGQAVDTHNRSLTAPEVELVRGASSAVKAELGWIEYSALVRSGMTNHLIYKRSPPADEARLTLPDWAAQQAAAEVEVTISRLVESGAEIIGRIEDLRSGPRVAEEHTIEHVPMELAVAASVGALRGAAKRFRRLEKRINRLEAELSAKRTPAETSIRELVAHVSRRIASRATSRRRSR